MTSMKVHAFHAKDGLAASRPPSDRFTIHRKMDSAGHRHGYVGTVTSVRSRARAWDGLVLLLVVCVLFEVLSTNQDVPLALSVPVGLIMTVPFLWGQRRPRMVAGVVLAAWLVQGFAGEWQQEPQSELLPVCLAFWCLGAYVPGLVGRWTFGVAFSALVVHQPDDAIVLGPLMAGVFAAGRLCSPASSSPRRSSRSGLRLSGMLSRRNAPGSPATSTTWSAIRSR